jgi:hypothetical protein
MIRRRLRLIFALAAVSLFATLCWLAPLPKTTQAAPAPSGDTLFKGKVLLVHRSNMMGVFLLEKAQMQKMGDCSWLVGKGAADDSSAKGRTVWLRMESIVAIIEYDNLKDAKKALELSGRAIGGKGEHLEAIPPPRE